MKVWIRGFMVVIGLAMPTVGYGQFDRVDEILSGIENRLTAGKNVPITAESVHGFDPQDIRIYLLSPIEWELEKLEIRYALLENAMKDRATRVEMLSQSIAELSGELLERGINDKEDFQAGVRRKLELKQDLNVLTAEIAALKGAAEQRAVKELTQLKIEKAQGELERVLMERERAALNFERQRRLRDKGLSSEKELEYSKAEEASKHAQMRAAELRLKQVNAEAEVVPGLSEELSKTMVMREQLQAQLAELSAEDGKRAESRQLLALRQRKELEQEISARRLAEMHLQLEQLELEKLYLSRVLEKYRKVLGEKDESDSEMEKAEEEK